jgi:hypothetical protein
MPYSDPEKGKQQKKDYYQLHKKELLEYRKNWAKTHQEQRNKSRIKWRNNNPEYDREYYETNKEQCIKQNIIWKMNHLEQVREYQRREAQKRRGLGFIPLNEWFDGSQAHHIDFECVVYIPKELHRSIYHNIWTDKGMVEINNKVFEWLGILLC